MRPSPRTGSGQHPPLVRLPAADARLPSTPRRRGAVGDVLTPAGKLPAAVSDPAAAVVGGTAYLAGCIAAAAKALTQIVTVNPPR
jgi:hypothetical protein